MRTWTTGALALMLAFLLGGCGGADNAPPTPVNNSDDAAQDNQAPDDEPDDTPPEDPNQWRKVEAPHPNNWETLEKYGLTELVNTNVLKKAPADATFLDGITHPRPPGATEQDEEPWTQWGEEVSAAALFHVGESGDALKALKDHGGSFVEGFDPSAAKKNGNVATAVVGGGKYVLAAISNANGTYLVVGVIIKEENRTEHERVIVKWAGSLTAN